MAIQEPDSQTRDTNYVLGDFIVLEVDINLTDQKMLSIFEFTFFANVLVPVRAPFFINTKFLRRKFSQIGNLKH